MADAYLLGAGCFTFLGVIGLVLVALDPIQAPTCSISFDLMSLHKQTVQAMDEAANSCRNNLGPDPILAAAVFMLFTGVTLFLMSHFLRYKWRPVTLLAVAVLSVFGAVALSDDLQVDTHQQRVDFDHHVDDVKKDMKKNGRLVNNSLQ